MISKGHLLGSKTARYKLNMLCNNTSVQQNRCHASEQKNISHYGLTDDSCGVVVLCSLCEFVWADAALWDLNTAHRVRLGSLTFKILNSVSQI